MKYLHCNTKESVIQNVIVTTKIRRVCTLLHVNAKLKGSTYRFKSDVLSLRFILQECPFKENRMLWPLCLLIIGEEAVNNLMSISPFQMKNLLYYILSGKEFEFGIDAGKIF